jgi:hypothetical protein
VCVRVLFFINILLSLDFFLSPCTTEQWLAYHWTHAYHSLINAVLDEVERRVHRSALAV